MALNLVPIGHAFTVIDAPQRSPAWTAARLGRLTSSRAADMLAMIKSGEAAGRRNLRVQLALERITGQAQAPTYQSAAMLQGIEREAEAAGQYETLTGTLLRSTGFLQHGSYMAGSSLDGHIGDFAAIVELKCPLAATHLEYLTTGQVPGDYRKQVVHALWVSGARWCDWVSYCPDFPIGLQLKVVRVERHDQEIASYALAAALFLKEVDAAVAAITELQADVREVA
jgi:predicted phage-related endonuclease